MDNSTTFTFVAVSPKWAKRSGIVRYAYLYRNDEVIGSMSRSENGLIGIQVNVWFTPPALQEFNTFVQQLVNEWK